MSQFVSWFRGIKGKLFLAAVFPVFGFCTIGYVSLSGNSQIYQLLKSAHADIIPNFETLSSLRVIRNRFSSKAFDTVFDLQDGKQDVQSLTVAKKSVDEFKKALAKYSRNYFMPEEAKRFEEVKPKYQVVIKLMEEIVSLIETKDPQNWDKARRLLQNEFNNTGEEIGKFNAEIVHMYEKRAEQEGLLAKTTEQSVVQWIWLITLCSTFLVMGVLFWIAARVSTSVSSVATRLSAAGTQVAAAVEQLNSAGNSLSQTSSEAAASLEETVASLEELSSMVQMNSDNAQQAAALSVSSREAAEKGQHEIEVLIQAMTKISQSSRKIEEIISVIDDIAFQTNLLALNAAVEAARAGEQGKGFAVVAEAVRSLAQRSAAAAKDITHLIKESVEQVEDGSKIAGQSGTVLNNIVMSVKKVSDLNNEIASASAEQTTGIQQISKAMNQLDQTSQSNAASAEEIAASSSEIHNLAIITQNLTGELNHVVNGNIEPETIVNSSFREKEKTNVVSFSSRTKPQRKAPSSKDFIPFAEDKRAKVGTTDGF